MECDIIHICVSNIMYTFVTGIIVLVEPFGMFLQIIKDCTVNSTPANIYTMKLVLQKNKIKVFFLNMRKNCSVYYL